MSRRKQSNPKPIKRDTDDESEQLSCCHNLPSDILRLKSSTETESGFSVYSTIPIPKGSSFGPFKGCLVTEKEHEYPNTIQFPVNGEEEKKTIALTAEGETGSWLKLIRTISDTAASNVRICLQDNSTVWCEIIQNIKEDMELLATLSEDRSSERENSGNQPSSPVSDNSESTEEKMISDTPVMKANNDAKPATPDDTAERSQSPASKNSMYPLIFGCIHCGIKFSSPGTLDAHMTYYCTKRPLEAEKVTPVSDHESNSSEKKIDVKITDNKYLPAKKRPYIATSPCTSPVSSEEDQETAMDHSHGSSSPVSTTDGSTSKSIKTGHAYECAECSYTTDKKSGLTRHMRIHNVTLSKYDSSSMENIKDAVGQSELYCHECNIQFTSAKTYRGHKEYYCQMRQKKTSVSEASPSVSRSPESPRNQTLVSQQVSPVVPALNMAAQSAASLVQNFLPPHILAPGSAVQSGSAVVLATPILTQNGLSNMAFSVPTVIMQPVIIPNNISAHNSQTFVPETVKPNNTQEEQPLDLSVPKDRESPVKETKYTDKTAKPKNSASPRPGTDTKTDKSSPNSPTESSNSAMKTKTSVSDAYSLPSGISVNMSNMRHPAFSASELSSPFVLSRPLNANSKSLPTSPSNHALPTASISKCLDCNIVFYKYENYVIHKKHYCSGRQRKSLEVESMLSTPKKPESEEKVCDSSNRAKSQESSVITTAELARLYQQPEEKLYLHQYFCEPCKIRFSSMDTLVAHRQYYCPSRELVADTPATSDDISAPSSPEAPDSVEHTCKFCDNSYPSVRLLKLHFCKATSVKACYVRCPYCDYIAQTDNRLIEHIKAHAPSKAYKCTLCGYRGNTIRGMRMHGKMHIDAGEIFTDDNMMEFEEPPLIPKRFRTAIEPEADVDLEAELIRLKNEPYKRRRSRKSYEKVENMSPVRKLSTSANEENGQVSDFNNTLHRVKLERSESIPHRFYDSSPTNIKTVHISERSHSSEHKPYTASVLSNSVVENHMKIELSDRQKAIENNEHSNTISPSHKPNEKTDTSVIVSVSSDRLLTVKSEPESQGYPDADHSVSQHKKNAESCQHQDRSPAEETKKEPHENGHAEDSSKMVSPTKSVIQLVVSPNSNKCASPISRGSPPLTCRDASDVSPTHDHDSAASFDMKMEKCKAKLCKQCGISFTYLATFIAHKKYYCNSHSLERSAPSPTVV